MQLSYWEIKSWFTHIDYTIVGSGIVGLNCALQLKQKFPKANILVLEKGILPQGASTKNAGFACFGSLSEILDDLKTHSEQEVLELVKKRLDGLLLLRQTLSDQAIYYQQLGGYELFTKEDTQFFNDCLAKRETVNKLIKPIFKEDIFQLKENVFNFKNIQNTYVFNKFEGQIDTGKMMEALLQKVQSLGIKILNNITVESYEDISKGVQIKTNQVEFQSKNVIFTTNGFASQLLQEEVTPARAQVLITKPIKNLHVQGTFHLDKGYYYFRNINNRILFGGGRNLDFKTEETTEFAQTELIQNKLKELLKTVILPKTNFEIDYSWSGIMGVGTTKKPIVKQLSNHVYCGVRLGGMGVAIGSLIGRDIVDLIE
ncbi:NAD(P)/FAD-dependent oxidoreductase [Xanthomarina gelatinilytica]|uniref:NAD(P)/FAD-dependent oxidoreductase n=1 Tax=Xanthomarina gelatinilytica TaxID=1137281 RepID=UPI003AA7D1AC